MVNHVEMFGLTSLNTCVMFVSQETSINNWSSKHLFSFFFFFYSGQ